MTARRPRGETRAALLGAARELLAERGLEAVTTRAVAERVGIRQPTLYAHFPSIDALLDAVAAQIGEELLAFTAHAQAELRQAGAVDLDANRRHWALILERAQEEREAIRLFLRFRGAKSPLGERMTALEDATRRLIAEHVRENLRLLAVVSPADQAAAAPFADAVLELLWGAVQLLDRDELPLERIAGLLAVQVLATASVLFSPAAMAVEPQS